MKIIGQQTTQTSRGFGVSGDSRPLNSQRNGTPKEVVGTMNIKYIDTKHNGEQIHHILNCCQFITQKKSLNQHRMEDYLLRKAGQGNFNTCAHSPSFGGNQFTQPQNTGFNRANTMTSGVTAGGNRNIFGRTATTNMPTTTTQSSIFQPVGIYIYIYI